MSDVRTLDFRTELNSPAEIRKTEHVLIYSTVLRDRFRVLVTKDGAPASLSGQTIAGYVLRPDGATVVSGFTVEKETDGTGYAAIVLPAEAYAVPGNVIISIFASDSSAHLLPLLAVRARVAKTTSDTVVDPGDSLPSVAELEALIAEAASTVTSLGPRVEALESTASTHTTQITTLSGQIGLIDDNLAPTFSTSNAYAAGSYVLKDMVLYRFKVDHAAGAWSASEVEAVSLGGDLSAETAQVDFLMGDQPTFEVSGETVSFYPAPGAKYKAVTSFIPVQDGTPTVDNPVSITGTSELGLSVTVGSGDPTEYEVEFDNVVFGGEYNWGTGEVKTTYGTLVLDGSSDESWTNNTTQGVRIALPSDARARSSAAGKLFLCNRLRNYRNDSSPGTDEIFLFPYAASANIIRLENFRDVTEITTVEGLRTWLSENPLTVVYPLKDSAITESAIGTPIDLTAQNAEYTIEANGGAFTASGYVSLHDYPMPPTDDGTHVLETFVSSSGVSYNWASGVMYMEPWQLMLKKYFITDHRTANWTILGNHITRVVPSGSSTTISNFVCLSSTTYTYVSQTSVNNYTPTIDKLVPVSVFGSKIKIGLYVNVTDGTVRIPHITYRFFTVSGETITAAADSVKVPATDVADKIIEETVDVPTGATHVLFALQFSNGINIGTYDVVYKIDRGGDATRSALMSASPAETDDTDEPADEEPVEESEQR